MAVRLHHQSSLRKHVCQILLRSTGLIIASAIALSVSMPSLLAEVEQAMGG